MIALAPGEHWRGGVLEFGAKGVRLTVSVGNSRSACERAVDANGRRGSDALTGHFQILSIRESSAPGR